MKQILYILIALCLIACKPVNPTPKVIYPEHYTLAYQEIYGHCYDSIPYAVVALDLYSDGLTLNQDHRIEGTGYNLYLSDIFVPDSLLAEGKYQSISSSSETISPFTFLEGRDFEGTPHGMYILHIEEDKISTIQVLDSGSFVYRNDSMLFTLYYRNTNEQIVQYQTSFTGSLLSWQKQ